MGENSNPTFGQVYGGALGIGGFGNMGGRFSGQFDSEHHHHNDDHY